MAPTPPSHRLASAVPLHRRSATVRPSCCCRTCGSCNRHAAPCRHHAIAEQNMPCHRRHAIAAKQFRTAVPTLPSRCRRTATLMLSYRHRGITAAAPLPCHHRRHASATSPSRCSPDHSDAIGPCRHCASRHRSANAPPWCRRRTATAPPLCHRRTNAAPTPYQRCANAASTPCHRCAVAVSLQLERNVAVPTPRPTQQSQCHPGAGGVATWALG